MKKFTSFVSFIVLLFVLNFCACSLQYQRTVNPENKIPQIIFEDAELVRYVDTKKNVELKSSRFEQYKSINSAFAKDATFVLFDSAKNKTSSGKAALICVDTKNDVFELYDGIEFIDDTQNIKINAASIKWNGKTEQLVSEKNNVVTIQKDDLIVTGKDFSASAISNTFLFSDSVFGKQILTNKNDNSKDTVTFSGDSMQGRVSSDKTSNSLKENSTVLSGNASVQTSTMTIKADTIELCGDDFNLIKARGNISGNNFESELEFKADLLEYNQDTKVVRLSGNVELVDVKNEVTAKAQVIEYDQNSDVAIMQVQVELKQKQNVCTGAYSIYRKKEQMLELSGNASVQQSDDLFRAQSIKFNMQTEEIVMDGNIRGKVTSKSE